jgi:hypothetical protein
MGNLIKRQTLTPFIKGEFLPLWLSAEYRQISLAIIESTFKEY